MSSWKDAVLLTALGLLTFALALEVVTGEPREAESWIIGGAVAAFGAAMCAAGALHVPRARTGNLPVVHASAGQLIVIPIRRTRVLLLAGLYAALLVASLGFGTFWVLNLARLGWQHVGLGRGGVAAACGLALIFSTPTVVRWARSQGSVGWVLERRGIALPAAPGVRSIPWEAVTGVGRGDCEVVFRGHSRTTSWLTIRTADPSRYARAKDLRPIQRRLGSDVTACVPVDMLTVRADVVVHQMRALLADPARREQLATTHAGQRQLRAPFAGESW